ncbi:MAG: hypothetical protein J6Z79_00195 [Clostridia bacterium]|nr:hypothetical protein [Clostridia bacterium]
MDAGAFASAGFSQPQMRFEWDGALTTVTDYTEKDGFYYFTFRGLTPTEMGKTVTASLSALKNGARMNGPAVTESVASYCRRAVDRYYPADETFCALIADLLTYGAESQLYFDVDAKNPATGALTADQLAMRTGEDPTPISCKSLSYHTVDEPELIWRGANLDLADSINLQFFFDAAGTDGLTVTVRDQNGNTIASFTEADFVRADGYWRICCDTLTPDRMDEALFITAYRAGSPVSNTIRYSVGSYAADAIETENDPALNTLLYAMLNYGASAKAFAGQFRVPEPASTPLYTFDHTPDVDEMRAMAVKAMRDELSAQWYTPATVSFTKTSGAVTGQKTYEAGKVFAGLPYTSAGIGLYQFLQYYNDRTGRLLYTDSDTFNETIGNTCASSAAWGLFSVCTSLRGRCISRYLTKSNGYIPLGEIDYDDEITDFKDKTTFSILEDLGRDDANRRTWAYRAYAEIQPGDLLVTSEGDDAGGHTMMAIEDATVNWNSGGYINGNTSYVVIQDQRDGKSAGSAPSYFGRTSKKLYFKNLFDEGYIPVTTAEFLGEKPYEAASVNAVMNGAAVAGQISTQSISSVHIQSNYPMAVARFIVNAGSENEQVLPVVYQSKTLRARCFTRDHVYSGSAFNWDLTGFANPIRNALRDNGYAKNSGVTVTIRVTVSNGAVFEPVTFLYN